MDPRITKLAEVMVDHSTKVVSGDKVVISASDFTNVELINELLRLTLQRGALPYVDFGINSMIGRADYGGLTNTFFKYATGAQLTTLPKPVADTIDWGDKFIRITTIHNKNFLGQADAQKMATWRETYYETFHKIINKSWVLTYMPTISLAQNSGMSLEEFTDFYYDAALVDYAEMNRTIQPLQDVMDAGSEVHIFGDGTDLRLGIEGRLAAGCDSGTHNIPDGECFMAPLEDKTEGHITFDLPQNKDGVKIDGVYLEFSKGEIVKYDAKSNKKVLDTLFNAHPGNRRLGELGIGMNQKITKYIMDILFDEKIKGTIHLAVGNAYESERGGGLNKGTIHWDMIKDLRHKGSFVAIDGQKILVDGEVVV